MNNLTFPTWLYHPTLQARVFQSPDELPEDPAWRDTPYPAAAAPAPAEAEPAAEDDDSAKLMAELRDEIAEWREVNEYLTDKNVALTAEVQRLKAELAARPVDATTVAETEPAPQLTEEPKTAARCACGKYTLANAEKKQHACETPKE